VEEIKIILAEKSYIIREGLKKIFSGYHSIIIEKEITELSKNTNVLSEKLKYDLLIINSDFFENSLNVFKTQFKKNDSSKIVVISYKYFDDLERFFENYILINETKQNIEKIFQEIFNKKSTGKSEIHDEELSTREKEILKEIALGNTNKEIAENLFISSHTVITHRKNITKKLGIKTVSGLTVYAILNNIISIEEAK
jgi:DNA-binding NarL/FixJ family response regulator